jgi:hypothetical protein
MNKIAPKLDSYNPGNDTNNCTVIALSAVSGMPYPEAYNICRAAGRRDRKGMYTHQLIKHFNENHSSKGKFQHIRMNDKGRMSLNQFVSNYPKGHFYLRKRGHAFVVSNGVVLDMSIEKLGKKTQVQDAWLFESKEKIKRLKKIVKGLDVPPAKRHNKSMKNKIRKGMTVETVDGVYIIRHINREITPALVMLTEKHKPKFGRKMYVRENCLQHSIEK